MRNQLLWASITLAATGCHSAADPPPEAAFGAPAAVGYSEARFSGDWYQRIDSWPCLSVLSVGYDTLSRYTITETMCRAPASTEAYTGYVTGDFLHVYGIPEHHVPDIWLHLEAGRQRLLMTYQPLSFNGRQRLAPVRDTFWLDSTRVTGRVR